MRTSRRPIARGVLLLTAVIGLVLSFGVAPAQAAVKYRGVITFDKNQSDPTNSKLTWQLYRIRDNADPEEISYASWRAGAGDGTTDECRSNKGWLPNGTYTVNLDTNRNGNAIDGVAFALPNKACNPNVDDGAGQVTRTELFIHSEMTVSGGQSCTSAADDPHCWDGVRDYKSNGCIKMSPAAIKSLANKFEFAFKEGTTYPKATVVLVVQS